jgi:glycosyltransferase involved in cell wall biosynthesis
MIAADIPHRLVLVGKAQRGEAALQEALDVGPRDRITRIDRVEFQHLAALYQRADLFVFPSLYEGFGLPVLEAMQAGTPVLAAREASVPEVGGDCILYTDANSPESLAGSLRDALNLPREKRSELIEAARMRAQTFSWQASATALLRTLAQAAGKPVEG